MAKRISDERKFQIKQMLTCGKDGLTIQMETGVSQSTICKIRKELEREGFDLWHVPGRISRTIR